MLPKDLLQDLEKGDRTREHLKKVDNVDPMILQAAQNMSDPLSYLHPSLGQLSNQDQNTQNYLNRLGQYSNHSIMMGPGQIYRSSI